MNRNELRKADINLMVVFETLMLERNVTRVAEKLFLIAATHPAQYFARRRIGHTEMNIARGRTCWCHTANVSGYADEWLAEIGRTRHVVLSVPQYSSLSALLAGTDLIASLPDSSAVPVSRTALCYMYELSANLQEPRYAPPAHGIHRQLARTECRCGVDATQQRVGRVRPVWC